VLVPDEKHDGDSDAGEEREEPALVLHGAAVVEEVLREDERVA
jgi:hypothetical protein